MFSKPPLDLDQLQQLLWSFAAQRVVTVAGRVGLLRLLAEQAVTIEQAADRLGLDGLATGKVVRALAALGVVEADGETYAVVAGLAPLLREGEEDLQPFLEHLHSMYERWAENLEPWLRGEGWTTHQRSPEEIHRFGRAMRAMGTQVARQLIGSLPLQGVRRVLDVGGGLGHYAQVLCDAEPALQVVVLDTPEVCRRGAEEVVGSAYEERIEFSAGDYLSADYGQDYDLVLLANVLHQEKAEAAAEMIRRAAAAMSPTGRLAVLDFSIDEDQRQHVLGALFAINMRSFGDTHTESTIRGWMQAVGLASVQRQDLSDYRWLIVGSRESRA